MTKSKKRTGVAILTLWAILGLPNLRAAQQSVTLNVTTVEQFKGEFTAVPCKDSERLNAVKALFERMGAAPSEVAVEPFKNVVNVVVRLPGKSAEKIVVGAHYDKVADGCGAIDNWTGVVAMAHLYRTLKGVALTKTVWFVAFGKEEKGLVGSHAMVDAIKKEEVGQYCAMINIDSLGMAAPQVSSLFANRKLQELAAQVAKTMGMAYGGAEIDHTLAGADADSSPFLRKKIPALTITGLADNWTKYLHTSNDKSAHINPENVYLGYRLALAVLASASESPCDAFR
jgi:Zn-dependent M28 family amino/carboxypeptidase